MTRETAKPQRTPTGTQEADEKAVRRVVGLVLRAAERGETHALLESVDDPASRHFLSELAAFAQQERVIAPRRPESSEMDALHPTSAELQLEEELEEDLTLADPIEAELLVWLSERQPDPTDALWERSRAWLTDPAAMPDADR